MMGISLGRLFLIIPLIGSLITFQAVTAKAFEIQKTEFVVGISDGSFEPVYSPSNVVPLLPDRACFGWRIWISGDEKLVFTREILKLPDQPAYWSGEDNSYDTSRISEDRTTATTEEYRPVKNHCGFPVYFFPFDNIGFTGLKVCVFEIKFIGHKSIFLLSHWSGFLL